MHIKFPKLNTFLDMGLFIFTIKTGLDISVLLQLNTYLDSFLIIAGLAMFIIAILQQGYTGTVLLKYAAITVISLYSTFLSDQSVIIITVITILAVRQTDLTEVIRKIRIWASVFLVMHLLCYTVLLIFGDAEFFALDGQGRLRASFGFIHANMFSIYLFNIILAWVWENYERLKIKHLIVIAIIETVSFFLTDSRTSYICVLILLFMLFLKIKGKGKLKVIHKMAYIIVPFLASVFLLLYNLWLKGNVVAYIVDNMLTGRIKLGAYALSSYGLTIWGQKMDYGLLAWTSEWNLNYFTLDCTYTSMWTNIGWIWILILSVCFFLLARKKCLKISIFIIIWALYAISEVHGLSAYLCFPILLITLLFSSKNNSSLVTKRNSMYGTE